MHETKVFGDPAKREIYILTNGKLETIIECETAQRKFLEFSDGTVLRVDLLPGYAEIAPILLGAARFSLKRFPAHETDAVFLDTDAKPVRLSRAGAWLAVVDSISADAA